MESPETPSKVILGFRNACYIGTSLPFFSLGPGIRESRNMSGRRKLQF